MSIEKKLEVGENLFFKALVNPLSANPTKWSNTQTKRQQIADELFECV